MQIGYVLIIIGIIMILMDKKSKDKDDKWWSYEGGRNLSSSFFALRAKLNIGLSLKLYLQEEFIC